MAPLALSPSQHLLVLISIILGLGLRERPFGARNALTNSHSVPDRTPFAMLSLITSVLFAILLRPKDRLSRC